MTLNTIHRIVIENIKALRAGVGTCFLLAVALSPLFVSATKSLSQAVAPASKVQPQAPPKTWIDAATGHRVTRLSDDPNSKSLYFDVNAFTPDGLDMIYSSPKGIYDLNLSSLESHLLVEGRFNYVVVGTKTRRVFYQNIADGLYHSVDIDTQQITRLPSVPLRGIITSVNADESLLVGTFIEGNAPDFVHYQLQELQKAHSAIVAQSTTNTAPPDAKSIGSAGFKANNKANADAAEERLASHTPEDMFTLNLQTGEVKVILRGTDWLNHVQFSPTDPTLIMYAHEGPALEVDRIWTIRADGSQNKLIRKRGAPGEIATHEFWSHDGKTIWYDQQKSKGAEFALAGYEPASGKETALHLTKAEASVHYNVASDDGAFCGDGNEITHGELGSHGHTTLDRKWVELLRPSPDGTLQTTRLASLSNHDYGRTEPNTRFSPDSKLVIFTSNMFGPDYVFAVEVGK